MISSIWGISRRVSAMRAGTSMRARMGPITKPMKRSMAVQSAPQLTWRKFNAHNELLVMAATRPAITAATTHRPRIGMIGPDVSAGGTTSSTGALMTTSSTALTWPQQSEPKQGRRYPFSCRLSTEIVGAIQPPATKRRAPWQVPWGSLSLPGIHWRGQGGDGAGRSDRRGLVWHAHWEGWPRCLQHDRVGRPGYLA